MYELRYNEDGRYIHTQLGDFTFKQWHRVGGHFLQYGFENNKRRLKELIIQVGPDILKWMFLEGAIKYINYKFYVMTEIGDKINNEIIEPEIILRRLLGEK